MQLLSSRIWTRVAVSISYDDNHCITGTSMPTSLRRCEKLAWCKMIKITMINHKRLNSSIWPIDGTQTSNTTPVRVYPGISVKKMYYTFLKAPGVEIHHQMQFSVIFKTFISGDLRPLQTWNRCILDRLVKLHYNYKVCYN